MTDATTDTTTTDQQPTTSSGTAAVISNIVSQDASSNAGQVSANLDSIASTIDVKSEQEANAAIAAVDAVNNAITQAPAIADDNANTNVTNASVAAINAAVAPDATHDSIVAAVVEATQASPAVTDPAAAQTAVETIVNIVNAVAPTAEVVSTGDVIDHVTAAVAADPQPQADTAAPVAETKAVDDQSATTQEGTTDAAQARGETASVQHVEESPYQAPVAAEQAAPAPDAASEPAATTTDTAAQTATASVADISTATVATNTTSNAGTQSADTAAVTSETEELDPATILNNPSISIEGKIYFQNILEYITQMHPRSPMNDVTGSHHQKNLFLTVSNIINRLNGDFELVFSAVLRLFHQHRAGVFHDHYVFRFMHNVSLNETEREAFLRIVRLMISTADPKGRQAALRQMSIEKVLEHGLSDAGRQRLLAFYKL